MLKTLFFLIYNDSSLPNYINPEYIYVKGLRERNFFDLDVAAFCFDQIKIT